MNIQWYPGHMTKTRRQIEADLKHVDIVAEIIDARIPISSRNPDIDAICADKPRLIVLNRADQADPAQNRAWGEYFRKKGYAVLETDAKTVTRGKQWVNVDSALDLLDTPGILWPKFEDPHTGMVLAFTGAVKDEIMDVETLGCHLMAYLGEHYPQVLTQSYKLPEVPARQEEENDIAYGYRLLEAGAAKRGMRISGGELDTERMARVLLDEYRAGKLGRFTLETPEGTSI